MTKSLTKIFSLQDTFNRTKLHNCNFVGTQILRLLSFFVTLAFLVIMLFIWVKACAGRILFLALVLWGFSQVAFSVSAGREVVEVKMLEKLKQKKRDAGANPETIVELELPSDEKSTLWKQAVYMYSFAVPLAVSVPIMYGIFWDQMSVGEICKFYSLAISSGESHALTPYEFE